MLCLVSRKRMILQKVCYSEWKFVILKVVLRIFQAELRKLICSKW
jgi:hypothetical protein